jgi:Fe-S cluster biogenesis protein NfuA
MNPSVGPTGDPRDGSSHDALGEQLNLALASVRQRLRGHAGDVVVAGVADGVVTLDYQGACRGCPALHFTHAAVVEPALEIVEGVTSVAPPRSNISPAVLERIRRMTKSHRPVPIAPLRR